MEGKADNPPSLQRYLYAYGNPTIYIDPDGRWPSLNDLIDVGTAAVESLVKTQRQVDKAVAKGIVNTAVNVLDFASLGSISAEKKRFDTFRNTKGSLIDKANAASQVSTVKERLNVVSLGFSGRARQGPASQRPYGRGFRPEGRAAPRRCVCRS